MVKGTMVVLSFKCSSGATHQNEGHHIFTAQKFGVYCRKKCTLFFWLDINFLTLVLQKYIDLKIF